MKEEVVQGLLTNWHPMRWITLAAGLLFGIMGVWHADGISLLLSGFLLYQAITNTGCLCGSCAVPARNYSDATAKDLDNTEFTEIKED